MALNHSEILGQMLTFSIQQHIEKDKTLEDLLSKNLELQKELADKKEATSGN